MFTDPGIVELFYKLHFKVRLLPDLCHHTLNCLAQLASLNGPVMSNKDVRVQYISSYLTHLVHLITGVELSAQEALGLSSCFRKLVHFFPPDTLTSVNPDLLQAAFVNCIRLTCRFAEQAEKAEATQSDDNLFMEAFDNMVVGWDTLGLIYFTI